MRSNRVRHTRIEALLQRVLLSVSVVKETLTIEGTTGKDEISLSVHPNVINLMSVKVNGDEKVFLLGSFKVININALGGNDTVRIRDLYEAHPAFLKIDLGAGNDRAYGSPHAETIIGGNGSDRISAGAGDDSVNGGAGDDVLVGDSGKDTLVGLAGRDTIFGGDDADAISGGDDADSMDGGNGSDTINAGAGNDRIIETESNSGASGSDVYGSRYANLINAGSGDDYLSLGRHGAKSSIFGGDGKDYLLQNEDMMGSDVPVLRGEGGDDEIIGVSAYGGDGNDTLVGIASSSASGQLDGESGNDKITLDHFSGTASGGAGEDYLLLKSAYSAALYGGEGNDRIESLIASDSMSGSYGITLNGGAGNDTLTGNNALRGDAGDDLLQPATGVLKAFKIRKGYDYPCDFSGGEGNDLLVGSAYADVLDGDAGDDIVHGGSSEDRLYGGSGDDILFGGNGVDELHGGLGNDSLFAGGFQDTRRDDDGKDYAYGEEGEDYFDEQSKWTETNKKKGDSTKLVSNSSGSLVLNDLTTGMNFNDLLSLAHNYHYGSSGSLTMSSSTNYVSFDDLLGLAQNYVQGGLTPYTPTPAPPTTVNDDAIAIFKNAAILSGTAANSPTTSTVSLPEISAAERRSIRGQIVHVPSNWQLTRVGVKSGLTWYSVRRDGNALASVYAQLLSQMTAGSRQILGEQNLQISVIGVHSASVVLYDGWQEATRFNHWADPQLFTSLQYWITKPTLTALLVHANEQMSFGRPDADLLHGRSLGSATKYIYTAQGLRPISANGVGEILS